MKGGIQWVLHQHITILNVPLNLVLSSTICHHDELEVYYKLLSNCRATYHLGLLFHFDIFGPSIIKLVIRKGMDIRISFIFLNSMLLSFYQYLSHDVPKIGLYQSSLNIEDTLYLVFYFPCNKFFLIVFNKNKT